MSQRHPADDADICAEFAQQYDSEGYTETEFRAAMTNLLAQGIIRRVPYITADGSIRFRIERVDTAFGAGRLSVRH